VRNFFPTGFFALLGSSSDEEMIARFLLSGIEGDSSSSREVGLSDVNLSGDMLLPSSLSSSSKKMALSREGFFGPE
jgi:hypothetical protein